MIIDAQGNLLEAEADALVNTVNTVGIMGKGIALQFKKAFPDLFADYQRACDRGELQLGRVHVYATGRTRPRFIINFPTKGHWRSKSRLEDVRAGLADLAEQIHALDITSIAVPPLGCGHGGLNWTDVRPLIVEALNNLTDVDIMVYAPEGAPAAAKMVNRTDRPNMTIGRAALVTLVARYAERVADVSLIEVQKLMYFPRGWAALAAELSQRSLRPVCRQPATCSPHRGGTLPHRVWRRQRQGALRRAHPCAPWRSRGGATGTQGRARARRPHRPRAPTG